ncbi:hypothetical protein OnM2_039014 [Erysiphe neolycopersici]|uniref:Uncharacterized protein n=1 Tax=Erysiphe neolycopersici TaxID=212602 RepID=A0A420HWF1_9PEZI|nr:hypothetical protein OnM2_039014 [Erysiphe neolycopersici]
MKKNMPLDNYDLDLIINRLIDNLNILVDDTQKLIDHEKITTEKLKFAREQYQLLISKYATEDPGITCILEQLNPPQPSVVGNDCYASINPSQQEPTIQFRLTATIDDIRLATQHLTKFFHKLSGSTLSPNVLSAAAHSVGDSTKQMSQTTVLEKDFTEPGIECALECPFSNKIQNLKPANCKNYSKLRINVESELSSDNNDTHLANKDIMTCPALFSEMKDMPHPAAISSKCPIRFLGQRSPEEVARYFEIHKHEIPRSHEICLKRQQRNEDHIRKLDAKYGDLVSIIEALGQKHQPLLPDNEIKLDTNGVLNERLECWVRNVSHDENNQENEHLNSDDKNKQAQISDRPLKEVRVGESPSRPWGISVPICSSQKDSMHESPQPTRASTGQLAQTIGKIPSKENKSQELFSEKNLAGQISSRLSNHNDPTHFRGEEPPATSCPFHHATKPKTSLSNSHTSPVDHTQPNFIKTHHSISASSVHKPHLLFTGPVLIGYSTEEAIRILQETKK